jgi:hypothetical protein
MKVLAATVLVDVSAAPTVVRTGEDWEKRREFAPVRRREAVSLACRIVRSRVIAHAS